MHRVARTHQHSLPELVIQPIEKNNKKSESVRVTVNSAILEGENVLPYLITSNLYDTKPINFLSSSIEEITWIMKQCKV